MLLKVDVNVNQCLQYQLCGCEKRDIFTFNSCPSQDVKYQSQSVGEKHFYSSVSERGMSKSTVRKPNRRKRSKNKKPKVSAEMYEFALHANERMAKLLVKLRSLVRM